MFVNDAREMVPIYAAEDIGFEFETPEKPAKSPNNFVHRKEKFIKNNAVGIILLFVWAVSMMIGCIVTGVIEHHNAYQEAEAYYNQQLEAYKADQARAEQAEHWLSGSASRDAAINQAVDAVAEVIAKLSTDAQKATEACCILARVMNPAYPNSFEEVCRQPEQWMFYDASSDGNTFTQRDREIAEMIVRPYMESKIVPNGLTDQMVYGEWSTNDFVLRDSYKTTSTMRTFRYQ